MAVDHAAPMADNAALVQRFIVQGYVLLPPSAPPEVHASVARDVLACGVQGPGGRVPYGLAALDGDAAGNNLLHAAPGLRGNALLESPPVTAALRALLGDGYRMHPHCRAHLRQRGSKTTMWHVDAYKGVPWSSGRRHELHDLMVCYYPQDTNMPMGPTELLPGSQYYRGDSNRPHYSRGHIPGFGDQVEEWATAGRAVLCPAGSVVLMHFDLWHRAVESTCDAPRLMLKFVAWRTEEPAAKNRGEATADNGRGPTAQNRKEGAPGSAPDELGGRGASHMGGGCGCACRGRALLVTAHRGLACRECCSCRGRGLLVTPHWSHICGERCSCGGGARASTPHWSLAHDDHPDLRAELREGGMLDFLGPGAAEGEGTDLQHGETNLPRGEGTGGPRGEDTEPPQGEDTGPPNREASPSNGEDTEPLQGDADSPQGRRDASRGVDTDGCARESEGANGWEQKEEDTNGRAPGGCAAEPCSASGEEGEGAEGAEAGDEGEQAKGAEASAVEAATAAETDAAEQTLGSAIASRTGTVASSTAHATFGETCARKPRSRAPPAIPAAALSALRLQLRTAPAERELFSGLSLFRARDVPVAQAAVYKSAVGEAKAMAARGAFEPRQLGLVIKWLQPESGLAVGRAAAAERAARFVEDRRLIWRHVWGWMHGDTGGSEGEGGEWGGGEECGGSCDMRSDMDDGGSPSCCAADVPSPPSQLVATPPQQVAMLRSSSEPERLAAAYALSRTRAGRRALIEVLLSKDSSTSERRTAVYGCIAGGAVNAAALQQAVSAAAAAAESNPGGWTLTSDVIGGSTAEADGMGCAAAAAAGNQGGSTLASGAAGRGIGESDTRTECGAMGCEGRGGEGTGCEPMGCEGCGCERTGCEQANPWHPIGGIRLSSDGGWMPANLIRAHDGFDAESMMAASNPAAAAAYAAALAFTRSAHPAIAAAPHPPAAICGCSGSHDSDAGSTILVSETTSFILGAGSTPSISKAGTTPSILGAETTPFMPETEPEAVGGTLLRLLLTGPTCRALSISSRLVLLGALGFHSVAPAHVRATARLACAIVSDQAADGAARAVAARVLSQMSARAITTTCISLQDFTESNAMSPHPPVSALRGALRQSVKELAEAMAGDADRYVRGHAAEALASIGMLGALEGAGDWTATHRAKGEGGAGGGAPEGFRCVDASDTGAGVEGAVAPPGIKADERAIAPPGIEADRAALAALCSAVEPPVVRAEAERLRALTRRLHALTDNPAWRVAKRREQMALAVHTAVRAVCAHRRCPLTHPGSPF